MNESKCHFKDVITHLMGIQHPLSTCDFFHIVGTWFSRHTFKGFHEKRLGRITVAAFTCENILRAEKASKFDEVLSGRRQEGFW